MKNLKFVNNPESYNTKGLVAHIGAVISEEDLFSQLSYKLGFPAYFGNNWNALQDCLMDFHWTTVYNITIVHEELPSLKAQSLDIYMQVLKDVLDGWASGEEHCFELVFSIKDEHEVCKLMTC